jgi:hypothetical protein
MNGLMLRRIMIAALGLSGALASDSVFASCGDRGRTDCNEGVSTMDRVYVIGSPSPFDVEDNCWGGGCWEW